jgi:hypothetical protein
MLINQSVSERKMDQIFLIISPIDWRYSESTNVKQLISESDFISIEIDESDHKVGLNTIILSLDKDISSKLSIFSNRKKMEIDKCSIRLNTIDSELGLVAETISSHTFIDFVPHLIIRLYPNEIRTYSSSVSSSSEVLFIHTGSQEINALEFISLENSIVDAVIFAIQNHQKHRLTLNYNVSSLKNFCPNEEIEYKINLLPGTNIWRIARLFYEEINHGNLEGFTLRFMLPMQSAEFDNNLFEVLNPVSQKGYISFIPCPDGRYIVKQKIYQSDSLQRIEKARFGVEIGAKFEDYLENNYPDLIFRKLSPFKRLRHNVNIESLHTGNIFSIVFDVSEIKGHRFPPLIQCEIEYIRTRSVDNIQLVMEELDSVYKFTKIFLSKLNISYVETFYSKLSYLKDFHAGVLSEE